MFHGSLKIHFKSYTKIYQAQFWAIQAYLEMNEVSKELAFARVNCTTIRDLNWRKKIHCRGSPHSCVVYDTG